MLTPDWPLIPGVRAACSLRTGGTSKPPYDSLNLGDHVGDDPEAVAENRRRFAAALSARPVFLKQVHGWNVARLNLESVDGTEADACITTQRGIACTIMVADCLPVLFADRGGKAVGAAHAGWRGLAGQGGQGVLEALWTAYWPLVAPSATEAASVTQVWLGPCIGPEGFEVGPEVRDTFVASDAGSVEMFRPGTGGKWFADLAGLGRRRLERLGIAAIYGNDSAPGWCTVSNPSRFFSHRRDRVSGRFAASVWLA
ncbi:peptidoglycan editing factor PgeF [Caenimonas sedimenti]|uniref:Purine nucleoside phosphorylase n=1 Tax=Caenimonas sedimenti TaxID=2596921 RepID=A0A562ZHA5_9BURK|nr:peptidoglycan editing factor PgeF [Caenimonas sedimenti]TWO67706.1 peptidoglycan editing factor PgeF [Caenimonas sedimenti]